MMDSIQKIPTTHIRPPRGWVSLDLKEMWECRELLYFFTWRDIKVKYKQTLLGFAWAVIVPFTHMIILGTIFGKVAKLPSDGLNPYLFYRAALVPWQYFSNALSGASNSMVNFSHILTKVYLPRLFVPLSMCISPLIDFSIALVMLLMMMLWLNMTPAATAIFVPLLILIAFATALGVGLFLAALNVKYRDIRIVIPFMIQIWMYCSVLLPFSYIPKSLGIWRHIYALNPMVGVIEACRWCLMHHQMFSDESRTIPVPPPWGLLAAGIPVSVMLLFLGVFYFRRFENMFADIV